MFATSGGKGISSSLRRLDLFASTVTVRKSGASRSKLSGRREATSDAQTGPQRQVVDDETVDAGEAPVIPGAFRGRTEQPTDFLRTDRAPDPPAVHLHIERLKLNQGIGRCSFVIHQPNTELAKVGKVVVASLRRSAGAHQVPKKDLHAMGVDVGQLLEVAGWNGPLGFSAPEDVLRFRSALQTRRTTC